MRIAPAYEREVVHVQDASRAAGVVTSLLDPARRAELDATNRVDQQRLREQFAARRERTLLDVDKARSNALAIEWRAEDIAAPQFTGRRTVEGVRVSDLVPYIDWTFFFSAWELKGKFPGILQHPTQGPAARELYDNARAMLERIEREHLLELRGVYGFWPAHSEAEDLVVYTCLLYTSDAADE